MWLGCDYKWVVTNAGIFLLNDFNRFHNKNVVRRYFYPQHRLKTEYSWAALLDMVVNPNFEVIIVLKKDHLSSVSWGGRLLIFQKIVELCLGFRRQSQNLVTRSAAISGDWRSGGKINLRTFNKYTFNKYTFNNTL